MPEENVSDDEIVELDIELDNEGVVELDNDPPQKVRLGFIIFSIEN